MMNGTWKQAIYLRLLTMIAHLPWRALYQLSDSLYIVARYVIRYRRKLVRKQLRMVFPEKDEQYLRGIEKNFYHQLCDVIAESVKLLHITDQELEERIRVENTAFVDGLAMEKRAIVLLLGHYGNWEWVQEILYHLHYLRYGGEIYKPLRNPVGDAVIYQIRRRFSRNLLIPQSEAVRTLLRLKQTGEAFMIGFISDHRPGRHQLQHWTTFLGQDTPFIAGAEHIGQKIGAEFVYLDVQKPARGHYILTFQPILPPPDETDYPYTRSFLQMMETTIRRQPELWLWTHNRWKHRRPTPNP